MQCSAVRAAVLWFTPVRSSCRSLPRKQLNSTQDQFPTVHLNSTTNPLCFFPLALCLFVWDTLNPAHRCVAPLSLCAFHLPRTLMHDTDHYNVHKRDQSCHSRCFTFNDGRISRTSRTTQSQSLGGDRQSHTHFIKSHTQTFNKKICVGNLAMIFCKFAT